ncbi:hypothetical protein PDE_05755 [Penicillium oxalicum 114-2]|uniref:Histone deacetylase domain-containing protein n=1 Tax=Penicillium oxalicum (strain 114-2 / CGMCC 5302) TaxID=933388 RepID=S8AWX7_PENO1|nr:hypothetical protein PDE_05755 [Penicillium oxalicum 114-2]
MDPSRSPRGDPPAPFMIDHAQSSTSADPSSHSDLTDSLNHLSLASPAAVPPSPPSSIALPLDHASRPSPPVALAVDRAPTPRRASQSPPTAQRDERSKPPPRLQKRTSTASLRSVSQPTVPMSNGTHATPRRAPSSSSPHGERRKSIPALQKRQSTASLRSTEGSSPVPGSGSSRRSSANLNGSPPIGSPAMAPRLSLEPQPQPPTAASVAAEHFRKEVDLHQIVDLKSKTAVIIHDACYGHRFSRPRASKSLLASIVERPERIKACVLGISAAYVRMGRRYRGEQFAPRPDLELHLLPPPPFQIRKTSRSLPLHDGAVTHVHGQQWMADLKGMCDKAESRLALSGKELVRPRSEGRENTPAAQELHSGDLYLCNESLEAFQGALGGVCDGVDAVFDHSSTTRAFVCIRPPGHHCSSDFPSGFCWINNVLVGISYAAMHHGLTHAAILDFDLHHGDGSQEIVWNHNYQASMAARNAPAYKKTAIGYYSLHDINSYPCEGGDPEKVRNASVCIDNAHGQSVWNVHLETWETEAQFWELYRTKYTVLIEKARTFLRAHTRRLSAATGPTPKAAIFISAGFDASEWEGTGMQRHKVNVPTEFYARFTADVVRMSQEEGLGVDGRVISVLEGGYSDRALTSGVLSHIAGLGEAHAPTEGTIPADLEYQRQWWSSEYLSELEGLTPPQVKREKAIPTFLSSTKSFDAKVHPIARDRRSFGSYAGGYPTVFPIPEVDWTTAAQELAKVLIPEESRQTVSCRPDELNAEASRQRRDRQLALEGMDVAPGASALLPVDEKRQLRVRKTRSPPFLSRPATPRQQTLRKNRRTTIDGNGLPDTATEASPTVQVSRRKSTSTAEVSVEPLSMAELVVNSESQTAAAATPDTSVSAPPAKVAGGRKTTGGTRGANTSKRTASPRKPPPVPKVPSAYRPSKLADRNQPGSTGAADDLENLSAGLRRIKLVVPSPEEHAEREKKIAEERRPSTAKPSRPSTRSPRRSGGSRTPGGKATGRRSLAKSQVTAATPAAAETSASSASLDVKKEERSESPSASSSSVPLESYTTSTSMPFQPSETPLHSPAPPDQPDPMSHDNVAVQAQPRSHMSPPFTPPLPQTAEFPRPGSHTFTSPVTEAGTTKKGLPVLTSSGHIPFATPQDSRFVPGGQSNQTHRAD